MTGVRLLPLERDASRCELETNRAGNARADVFFVPADVAGSEGVHGVMWTVQNAADEIVYRTGCSIVTLD